MSRYGVVEHLDNGDTITHKPIILAFTTSEMAEARLVIVAGASLQRLADQISVGLRVLAHHAGLPLRECTDQLLHDIEATGTWEVDA